MKMIFTILLAFIVFACGKREDAPKIQKSTTREYSPIDYPQQSGSGSQHKTTTTKSPFKSWTSTKRYDTRRKSSSSSRSRSSRRR